MELVWPFAGKYLKGARRRTYTTQSAAQIIRLSLLFDIMVNILEGLQWGDFCVQVKSYFLDAIDKEPGRGPQALEFLTQVQNDILSSQVQSDIRSTEAMQGSLRGGPGSEEGSASNRITPSAPDLRSALMGSDTEDEDTPCPARRRSRRIGGINQEEDDTPCVPRRSVGRRPDLEGMDG